MDLNGGQAWGIFKSVIIIIAALYILVVLFMYIFQTRFIYFPAREISITPASAGLTYEDVYFKSRDGLSLNGWFVPSDSARGTILFCHGNAGNISHCLESIRIFNELGLNVFIFDYRGYGQSEGSANEEGSYLDADAAYDYLIGERNIDPRSSIIFGRSLGGAVAAELASTKKVAALIIESAFTSIQDLGSEIYPFLPVRLLSRFEYNTLEKIESVDCPKMIIHSRDDEMIPFRHSRRIFEAAGEPKDFMELSGGHNDGFLTARGRYKSGIGRFLDRILR
jgi:fermentation-respiration switch protein FrsA (DUF1100 family)